jgi:hypothetical protein
MPSMTPALSLAQWNRTFLSRQRLLERAAEPALSAIRRNVVLQSQDPQAAFYALWCRIDDFDPGKLDSLMRSGEAVRIALFRNTVMAAAASDVAGFRAISSRRIEAHWRARHHADPEHVCAAARKLLAQGEMSSSDMGAALAERWPGERPAALTRLARGALPLVQTLPRGLWRASSAARYRLADDFPSGSEPTEAAALREATLRYLGAFGPSTAKAVQSFTSTTGIAKVLKELAEGGAVRPLAGPGGEALYDLVGASLVDGDAPAPPRLLAPFDHAVVSNGDRQRVISDAVYRRIATKNGVFPGFILVDGFVAGTWKLRAANDRRVVELTYADALSSAAKKGVAEEAARLEEFANLPATQAHWGDGAA